MPEPTEPNRVVHLPANHKLVTGMIAAAIECARELGENDNADALQSSPPESITLHTTGGDYVIIIDR